MISHKHEFIFIHIPKCAGTSIECALLKAHGVIGKPTDDQKQEFGIWYKQSGIDIHHRKIDEYDDIYEKKYFTFTFVRNPWERFLSEYFYIKRNQFNRSDFSNQYPTFKHFVKNNGIKYCYYAHDFHQIDFVFNSNHGKLANFVGRVENMQYDFNYVCGKIGLPKIELPYNNPTKHKHYTEYYDDETREIVAKKYEKDIEYFGYEFRK
tara:strand:- start:509 stop:1132 length:624 start_codon:yes stop_codon:yes gene_type:complete